MLTPIGINKNLGLSPLFGTQCWWDPAGLWDMGCTHSYSLAHPRFVKPGIESWNPYHWRLVLDSNKNENVPASLNHITWWLFVFFVLFCFLVQIYRFQSIFRSITIVNRFLYPAKLSLRSEKLKHGQINKRWGSSLLLDLPCKKCWGEGCRLQRKDTRQELETVRWNQGLSKGK